MKYPIGIWIVRPEALPLARALEAALPARLHPAARKATPAQSNRAAFAEAFPSRRQWLLVMTTGIAVRYLQGLLKQKQVDPGVVVLDEAARFAVSLVGGHEGGANDLAYSVANAVGAVPVVTTATEALKPLVLGIGCRKGIAPARIADAVRVALAQVNRPLSDVRTVATLDLKAREPGLLAWCRSHNLPLQSIATPVVQGRSWVTQPSAWVRKNVGVDGVCEPCALIASHRGRLLLPKSAQQGVTVAVVEDSWSGTGAIS